MVYALVAQKKGWLYARKISLNLYPAAKA
jgi:hypothetical protein